MKDTILYLVACFVQMIVFLIYTREILGLKRKIRWFVISWFVVTGIDDLIVRQTNGSNVLVNAVLYLLCMEIVAFIMCNGSWQKKLFAVLAFDVFVIAMEVLIVNMLSILSGKDIDTLRLNRMLSNMVLIVTQMLVSFVIMLVIYIWKRQKEYNVSTRQWIGILFVSLGCFASISILSVKALYEEEVYKGYIAIYIILIVINYFNYYYYIMLAQKNKAEIKTRLQMKQLLMYEEWYEEIKNVRKEIISFRHDMRNHFSVLGKLCDDGRKSPEKNIRKIREYLDSLGMEYQHFNSVMETGNMALDAVVGIKKSNALSKGIKFDAEINVPLDMESDSMDLVIIFGNLLDNAIEACEKTEGNKEIKLEVKYILANLFITIENTYNGSLDGVGNVNVQSKLPETTKKDSLNHGVGLQNVKETVNKYGGEMSWTAKDNVFKVEILMYHVEKNIKKDELLQKSN